MHKIYIISYFRTQIVLVFCGARFPSFPTQHLKTVKIFWLNFIKIMPVSICHLAEETKHEL